MPFQNVGGIDRSVRLFLGILLLAADALLIPSGSPYEAIVAFVGVMVLVTGLLGFCILYVPFGLSTANKATAVKSCCGEART